MSTPNSKTLVAYFSASGETARLAKIVADVVNADTYEIVPEQQYTSADLDWKDAGSRSSVEMKDHSFRPVISGRVEDIDQYGIVFIGFPIWWYEAPRIVQSFLENYDFSGKTVIPFATSGSSAIGNTESILQKSCSSQTNWRTGKRLNSNIDKDGITAWVDSLKLFD